MRKERRSGRFEVKVGSYVFEGGSAELAECAVGSWTFFSPFEGTTATEPSKTEPYFFLLFGILPSFFHHFDPILHRVDQQYCTKTDIYS